MRTNVALVVVNITWNTSCKWQTDSRALVQFYTCFLFPLSSPCVSWRKCWKCVCDVKCVIDTNSLSLPLSLVVIEGSVCFIHASTRENVLLLTLYTASSSSWAFLLSILSDKSARVTERNILCFGEKQKHSALSITSENNFFISLSLSALEYAMKRAQSIVLRRPSQCAAFSCLTETRVEARQCHSHHHSLTCRP